MASKKDRNQRSSAAYRRDLEKLFNSGGDVPERFKSIMEKLDGEEIPEEVAAWKEEVDALREALDEGFRPFVTKASAFVRAGHPLPDDEDLLVRLLDHPQARVLEVALEHLIDLDERASLRRPERIKSRFRTIRTMTDSPKIIALLEDLEQRVG